MRGRLIYQAIMVIKNVKRFTEVTFGLLFSILASVTRMIKT